MYIVELLFRILLGDTPRMEVTDGIQETHQSKRPETYGLLITRVGSEPNQSAPIVTAAPPVGGKQTIE